MGRVVYAINGVHKSLSPNSLLPLTRPPHNPNHFEPQNTFALSSQNKYYIQLWKRIFFDWFLTTPALCDWLTKPTRLFTDTWASFTRLHRRICSWLLLWISILLYWQLSEKKKPHLFLTTEWRVVQSSWSILEQYMGRWPKAIIQGLLARFSGLFASLRSFVNHSSCSATGPLVK